MLGLSVSADLKDGAGINALADDGSEVTLRGSDLTFEQEQALDRGETVTVVVGEIEHTLRTEHAEPAIVVQVTRSSGPDGAVLVMVDTTFEPNAIDGGPGLRILVNDEAVYTGTPFQAAEPGQEIEAPAPRLEVHLADIAPQ